MELFWAKGCSVVARHLVSRRRRRRPRARAGSTSLSRVIRLAHGYAPAFGAVLVASTDHSPTHRAAPIRQMERRGRSRLARRMCSAISAPIARLLPRSPRSRGNRAWKPPQR
ncbi:MAG: hypothetical protein DMF49_08125 [Acidobacteria bacterium]|nr:MAG: hypothetical protein DMF49_08125 [Acidobacteriota bacterium]